MSNKFCIPGPDGGGPLLPLPLAFALLAPGRGFFGFVDKEADAGNGFVEVALLEIGLRRDDIARMSRFNENEGKS